MSKKKLQIDAYFAFLIGILAIWWLLAGGAKTPASEIASLETSRDARVWVDALASRDREVRAYAHDRILKSVPLDSLGSLAIGDTQSDDPGRQLAGLWLLSKVDARGRGDIARPFLKAETIDLRRAALDVLAQDPSPAAHDELVKMLDDEDSTIQAGAVAALAAIAEPGDLRTFIDSLNRGDPVARNAAHDGVLKIVKTNPGSVATLYSLVAGSDMATAKAAVEILGEVGGQDVLAMLFDFLENGTPTLGNEIADAIGKIDGDDARTRALEIFLNPQSNGRRGAARTLEALGYKNAGRDLLNVVLDQTQEFWLRFSSMEALTTCGSGDLVPEVLRFVQDRMNDPRLVRMGIEALGGMGGASVLQVYDTVIDGSEDFGLNEGQSNGAKIAVVAGLGHMNSDESRDRLRKLLKRISLEDTDLIMQVIRSLGKVGTRDDIDALKQAKEGRRLLGPGADDAVKSIEDRYPAPAESSR